MTFVALTVVSLVVLAGLAWLASKTLRIAICPICLGVVGTWLWMVIARVSGFAIDSTMLAVLLGASVVGVAERLEARLRPPRAQLLWKAVVLPVGFVAAYAVAAERWEMAAVAALALVLVAAGFLLPGRSAAADEAAVKRLEEEMKRCC